jgi:ABC-type sugar transport system permease subunit
MMIAGYAHKRRVPYRRSQKVGYLFILPSCLIYLLFVIIPIGWSGYLSLTDYNLKTASFVGLVNYVTLFQDTLFHKAFLNTVVYTLLTMVPNIVIGLGLALLINKRLIARGVFRAVFYLPHIISLVAASLAWSYLFSETGMLNMFFRVFGLSRVHWLTSTGTAMLCIVIVSLWMDCGHNMILFLAGLQGIPPHLYEAASLDGANSVQTFRYVTLPMLAPTTFFVFIMSCIASFQVFGQVYILTGGGPDNATTTIAHQIYLNIFQYYKMGYASSMAIVLLLVVLLITTVNYRFGNGQGGDIR